MKKVVTIIYLFALLLFGACRENVSNTHPLKEDTVVNYLQEPGESFDQRMEWWRDARFGMFIHFGPYAVPAGMYDGKEVKGIGEWIMNNAHIPVADYEKFAKEFNPQKFDADTWAKIMKDAGMKYVVITSKHHDGFALWDSKVSDYTIVKYSPYGKDLLKALSAACKKEGIRFGLYHSIMDWHHPQAQSVNYPDYNTRDSTKVNPEFRSYFESYLKPQLKELIENYDPDILWFDGEWIPDYTHEMGQELYQYIRSLKPSIIINNRVDKGRQGMQGMNASDDKQYAGDFGTPEQEILAGTADVDWESCMTMNDTWGFKKNDNNWKSANTLVQNLIEAAAKGGNYLLNVGPTPEGEIPAPSVERLREIGQWLQVNGESIYGTGRLDHHFSQGENIWYTRKKDESLIYAIAFETPGKEITLDYVAPEQGSTIMLLGYEQPLNYTYTPDGGLKINVPQEALAKIGKTHAWTFKIKGQERNKS